jgi:PilZ domain
MIHDMSTTGLGMVFNQPFDAGTELTVELQSPDMALLYTVLRVVHSTRQANGSYLIGCAFLRELSEEELRNLL